MGVIYLLTGFSKINSGHSVPQQLHYNFKNPFKNTEKIGKGWNVGLDPKLPVTISFFPVYLDWRPNVRRNISHIFLIFINIKLFNFCFVSNQFMQYWACGLNTDWISSCNSDFIPSSSTNEVSTLYRGIDNNHLWI